MPQIINDPRTIEDNECPMGILANTTTEIPSDIIDWSTNSAVDHAMIMVKSGFFACQGFTGYKSVPISNYMKAGARLKFISLINITPEAAKAITDAANMRLQQPWYKNFYDWLGIFGQAIHCPWIHWPGGEYCSVDFVRCFKAGAMYMPEPDRTIILGMNNQSNPNDINLYIPKYPNVFNVKYEYLSDDGVIVK